MAKYVCDVCGYIYDPAVGDPDNGIAPGTAFADLPELGLSDLRRRQRRLLRGINFGLTASCSSLCTELLHYRKKGRPTCLYSYVPTAARRSGKMRTVPDVKTATASTAQKKGISI